VPQLSRLPQRSEIVPHVLPSAAQLLGVQQVPFAVQTWPAAQQCMSHPQVAPAVAPIVQAPTQMPPQHVWPALQVDAQVPFEQVWHGPQVPQVSVPPQPSEIVPHVLPWAAQVVGVQPHALAVPPPPHVCGAAQQVALP
jgi:hypothetical protein